jgi:signal transduction histidine kinase
MQSQENGSTNETDGAPAGNARPHANPSDAESNRSDRTGYTYTMHHPLFSRLSTRLTLGVAGLFAILLVALGATGAALFSAYRALEQCTVLTHAEREAAAIGVAAREQFIHESHGIITRDEVHVGHDRQWAAELAERVARLRPLVSESERALLDHVHSNSAEMGRTFAEQVFPAALAGDLDRVRAGHALVQAMMEDTVNASDRAVQHLAAKEETQAAAARARARIASVTAAVTTLVAMAAAVALAVGLVRSIVGPLADLSAVAARIGQGDFDAEVPPTGAAEFENLRAGLGRMAAELREREARLLKAERLAGLGALAAGVAHELNNPLGVILGYAKTLRRSNAGGAVEDDLRIIEEEAHQCRRIVEDLVAFAREPRLERRAVDVTALVRDVVSRLSRSGELADGQVRIAGSPHAELSADSTRIGQVLRNLLLNAASASSNHTPIDALVEDRLERVVIRIEDHGTGIADEDIEHLFEPFFSRRPGGTGLGLAVSHGIVLAHGGQIDIQSRAGHGTTVTLELPKHPEQVR